MCNNSRVFNVTRGHSMKHKQALKAIEACACVWVEFGVSVRDLSLAEAIAARNEQASKKPRGLSYFIEGKDGKLIEKPYMAELPGIVYRPAERNTAAYREEVRLMQEANRFAAAVIGA